jgi:arylsulfatase A
MFYHAAAAANASRELFAVRCGAYKMYWSVFSSNKQPYPEGVQNPPLLFNLESDPGESYPIPSTSTEYKQAAATVLAAKIAHLQTISPVPNQNGRGSNPSFAFCADPNSKAKFPRWPACTISPANWTPAQICSSPACLAANPAFNATCAGPSRPQF